MVTSEQMWNRVAEADATGHLFSVVFRRKNPKFEYRQDPLTGRRIKVEVEPAGSVRRMLCRRRVHRYTRGIIPAGVRLAEDVRCQVLTVWDVQFFQQKRREGMGVMAAGRASYRRINMAEVIECSLSEAA